MNGGTYSEARKAGFTEDQAGFLGRLSSETKSETIEYLDTRQEKHLRSLAEESSERWADMRGNLFLYSLGALSGVGVALTFMGK